MLGLVTLAGASPSVGQRLLVPRMHAARQQALSHSAKSVLAFRPSNGKPSRWYNAGTREGLLGVTI
jgi:hypothetical protein